MRLKRVEAPTVAEAMRRLRGELGDNAVILHTRTLSGRGLVGQAQVEILGAVDEPGIGLPERAVGPAATPGPAEVATARDRDAITERLARFRAAVPGVPLASPAPPAAGRPGPGGIDLPPGRGLTCLPPVWTPVGGRARRIAFVGPTGAGKTTTLAKVAARAQLDFGRRVSLITIDTYRIGAVPQLASYADILGAPLDVAYTPAELARAVERRQAVDLVFVDTTGRSPLGEGVEGLRAFLDAAGADDVILVLSVTTRLADSLRAAAAFARLGPNRLCVTKLDETDYHEPVAALAESTGLPLTWLANGQNVPDDLEEASLEHVHALVTAGRGAA